MSNPNLLPKFRWDVGPGRSWFALSGAVLWQGGSQSDSAKAVASNFWTFLGEHPIVLRIVVVAVIVALVAFFVVAYKRGIRIGSLRIGPPAKQSGASEQPKAAPLSRPSKSEPTNEGHELLRLKLSELDQRLEGHARRRLTCWYSTHEFMEDFSVHLQSESWLQAVDGPPWAVSYERGSDDAHFQGFAPLRLRVLGGQKERELPWLPVRDAPSNKRFLVFFVPPLQPGQEPYRVVVDCNLPGAAGTLRLPNAQDEYIVRVPDSLTESVPEFKLIVRMRAEKGDFELSCQIKGRSFCQTPGEMRSRQFGGPSRQGDSSASRSCANDDSGCLNR